ncbi:hemin-degrading factor [Kiloniella sp. b19]|uniref:hemin-degrading factor n=1 Tax=Kiloniella sp. GXU_MW_B19 TaxID=3141326 RepID=UPI0031DDDC09
MTSTHKSAENIRSRHADLLREKPGTRIRDAAAELNLSEADLIASRVGHDVILLKSSAEEIIKSVKQLGKVMALTRNESCVHERKGVYDNAQFFLHGPMQHGLLVNDDIDLRLFMHHWKHIFAVLEQTEKGLRKSLQFFDKAGMAVHKIYLTETSDEAAFDSLVRDFTAEEQIDVLALEDYKPKATDLPDQDIDWSALRTDWENLKDTHDFHSMLRKHKAGRVQAFRNIGSDFAYEVAPGAIRAVLEKARDTQCKIMVFVGNHGCIQIHGGHVETLRDYGPWFNVLDPDFNLHLRTDHIASCWVSHKPTTDGHVTALELFDSDNGIIATLFGWRRPGIPELPLWREIIDALPPKDQSSAA